ncbi:MAG: hypothetical protein KC621_25160 [Myxococcales bacterium]|nr:hypothetical protein [Myxococcales bacterium]
MSADLAAGDLVAAAESGDAALALSEPLDDPMLAFAVAANRGEVALRAGDRRTAVHLARRMSRLVTQRVDFKGKAPGMEALLYGGDLEDDTFG